jgi:hypothetical protein
LLEARAAAASSAIIIIGFFALARHDPEQPWSPGHVGQQKTNVAGSNHAMVIFDDGDW